MEKILSLIVPAYNSEKFLEKCVNSFLDEAILKKLDIIIVNDGSTDNTKVIADNYSYEHQDSVRVIHQENKGHGGALNAGLAAAKGKYSKVIDADDWIVTENLPKFLEVLEKSEAEVILTHHYTYDVGTGKTKKWKSYPESFEKSYTHEEIMESWKSFDRSLTFHGITYKTSFYQEKGMKLSEKIFYEDHEYATVPCCFAKSIMPVDIFFYVYRVGDTSQSVSDENQLKRIGHTRKVLERLISEYNANEEKLSDGQKKYFCMKAQGLLLSFLMTALLVNNNRKSGRQEAKAIMNEFENKMPEAFSLAVKQYKFFYMMNRFGLKKSAWEKLSSSKIYNKIRKNHSFD